MVRKGKTGFPVWVSTKKNQEKENRYAICGRVQLQQQIPKFLPMLRIVIIDIHTTRNTWWRWNSLFRDRRIEGWDTPGCVNEKKRGKATFQSSLMKEGEFCHASITWWLFFSDHNDIWWWFSALCRVNFPSTLCIIQAGNIRWIRKGKTRHYHEFTLVRLHKPIHPW